MILERIERYGTMKIGIIGGTGDIGEGLARRLSHRHEIILGSRDEEKACYASECTIEALKTRGLQSRCCGATNQETIDQADIVVLSIPFRHVESTIRDLGGFEGKIVISPVNPMQKSDHFYYDPPQEGSAALFIKKRLPENVRLVTAFNNIAANKWKQLDEVLDYSVPVCGDDQEAKQVVMKLVEEVSSLRALDAGPLSMASVVESITPLLLNIARLNGMKDVGIQFR
jgi:NADPH-dependent F420 reductase